MKIAFVANEKIFRFESGRDFLPWIYIAAVLLITAVTEYFQGRVLWCRVGDMMPWSWEVWTPHNSQHLIDPYSFTHILHGVVEFFILGLLFPRLPVIWRLVIALFVEGTWEMVENTSYVINRYREATISLNYYGDSIANSLSDIICCGLGFLIGNKLRFWWSLALFIFTEAVLIATIHDSLIINVIMLLYPSDWIRDWQMAGAR